MALTKFGMKTSTIKNSKTFFRGVLRTSRESVILVAVENMPPNLKVAKLNH